MAQQNNWEADKMLDVYIYDYLLKRNLQTTAKAFMAEGKVAADPVAIDAPGGFLFEWWSVFWDIFIARTNDKHSEQAAAYLEAQQMKAREHQQQLQIQQLQLIQQRQAQLQRSNSAHLSPAHLSSEGLLGPSTASVLAAKMYEERLKQSAAGSMDSDVMDAGRMALLKSAANNHAGQLVQGNPNNMSTTLQQIQQRNQQMDIKTEGNLSVAQRSLPMDPSSIYGQGIIQSKTGLAGPGLNQGVSGLPLKGWPLTGIDQLRPNLTPSQLQKPFLSTHSSQFQLMSPHQQQQLIAQAQAAQQGNNSLANSFGDRFVNGLGMGMGMGRGSGSNNGPGLGLNGKDPVGQGGEVGDERKVRQEQAEYLMKLKVAQLQQQQSSSSQQNPDQLQQQQQQLQQNNSNSNNRKRKQATSSGPANSTGTGNTAGPSASSPPSTPSTTHNNNNNNNNNNSNSNNNNSGMHHVKSLMMYGGGGNAGGAEGAGLGASSTQMDDLEHFGDVASLDDNVESFLSNDDGDPRDIFAALKTEHNPTNKGFTFNEAGVFPTSNKLVCCHFSSDGKYLASAGHEKKAIIWNMDTLQTQSTPEDHGVIITDLRFRPNSTQLATSSFDRTVKLWNAAEPGFCLHTFSGHSSHVTSLDFHPKKTDILCSCDGNGEIRLWSVSQLSCNRVSKGGTAQVRFQPNVGQLLAAAAENVVSIFDVETDRKKYTLQGHMSEVHSLCWDNSGEYLASVSQDSVKVWSINTGDCIHELGSNSNNKFHSCVFHPSYSNLLVIGGYKTLELWNMAKNQTMTVQAAHECLIAALAQSPATGMVASASHDHSVKLWK